MFRSGEAAEGSLDWGWDQSLCLSHEMDGQKVTRKTIFRSGEAAEGIKINC